ncbi:MAG: CRISPR-associated helicase Cas3' [Bacteroidota bacterium]
MEYLAKPSGITLKDHRQHVFDEALSILKCWPFLEEKYNRLTGADLRQRLADAAWWHDRGKAHDHWQEACQKDYRQYQQWLQENGYDQSLVDPLVYKKYETAMRKAQKFVGKHLMGSNLRHEFASIDELRKAGNKFPLSVEIAIAAHHGKLSFQERHLKRWRHDGAPTPEELGPFAKYFKEFKWSEKLESRDHENEWENRTLARFEVTGVRSLLQLADTRASRLESGEKVPQLSPFTFEARFKKLRPVQEAALSVGNEPISILRAPTGSGKTYAALLWANEQIKSGKADRLVIAMPTRFTSNALAIGVEEATGETGLYHSSAWFNRYGDVVQPAEKSFAKEMHLLARKLATPVNVCTIDHLLICLTGGKEVHHSTFFFLANSAVVFDEADFYDSFIQGNLTVLLQALRVLKVPVLIMSATVPDSAQPLYQVDLPIISPKEKSDQGSYSPRELKFGGSAEEPEDIGSILKQMVQNGNGIVYANTIARAMKYYRWFQQKLPEDVPLILYHSKFTEPDKANIEAKLLKVLGKEAWEGGKEPFGIAILTQIGEMSVNISTNFMVSDLCPWDRLAQRIGRLSRFNEKDKDGMVYVVEPLKNEETYPAPYGSLENREWVASEAFLKTLEDVHTWEADRTNLEISSDELVELVNNLYPTPPEFEGRDRVNLETLRKMMKQHWLIVPDRKVEEDGTTKVSEWESRHISPQETVFVQDPVGFERYEEFSAFSLEYGIAIPSWIVQRERRKKGNSSSLIFLKRNIVDEEHEFIQVENYDKLLGLGALYENSIPKPEII